MTDDEAAVLRDQCESLLKQHENVKTSLSLAMEELEETVELLRLAEHERDEAKDHLRAAEAEIERLRMDVAHLEKRCEDIQDQCDDLQRLPKPEPYELQDELDDAHRLLGLDRAAPIDRWMARQGRYEPPRSAAWR